MDPYKNKVILTKVNLAGVYYQFAIDDQYIIRAPKVKTNISNIDNFKGKQSM